MFKDKLRECRKRKGFSQTQLASRIGVTRQAVSRWESGDDTPGLTRLAALAAALDVSLNDLLPEPSEDKKNAPAGMAANGGDNYGIQLNNSENNGTISQGVIMGASASASDTVDADLEAALRLRQERPEIIKLLADKDFTAAQIRALASAPRDEKDKD